MILELILTNMNSFEIIALVIMAVWAAITFIDQMVFMFTSKTKLRAGQVWVGIACIGLIVFWAMNGMKFV